MQVTSTNNGHVTALRIAFVTPEIIPASGGISTYSMSLVWELSREHDVLLVFPGKRESLIGEIERIFGSPRDNITLLPTTRFDIADPVCRTVSHQIGLFGAMKTLTKNFRPDVVHFAAPHGSGVGWQVAGHQPSIVTVHSTIAEDLLGLVRASSQDSPMRTTDTLKMLTAPLLNRHEDAVLTRASAIISVSEHSRSDLSDAYRHIPVHLVENGVNTDVFSPAADVQRESGNVKRILVVARPTPSKGIQGALKCCEMLMKEGRTDFRFEFAGSGDWRSYQELALSMGIGRFCSFRGSIDFAVMPDMYRSVDVFCSSSIQESSPMSILEAMATALPCVVTNVGSAGEMIEHGRSGLVTEPGECHQLADALRVVLDDHAFSMRLGRAARTRVIESYSATRMCNESLRVYGEHGRA